MTYEEFEAEVNAVIAAISAIKSGLLRDMPDTDICIPACEAAAAVTGSCPSYTKIFNRNFRNGMVKLMFERAQQEVA